VLLVAVGCGSPAPKLSGPHPDGAAGTAGPAGSGPGTGGGAGTNGGAGANGALPDGGAPEVGPSVADWVPIRYLTNFEYDHSIRELLGVDAHAVATFQPDGDSGSPLGDFDVFGGVPVTLARVENWSDKADELATAVLADPALRARIITCQPAGAVDTACTKAIVGAFGLRAWRRPLTADETDELVTFATSARAGGATFDESIRQVVMAMLTSAPFLFRMEIDPDPAAKAPRALTAYELASRLSFFLWSSGPDARLLQLAADGTLLRTEVLRGEVVRLIKDVRSQAFVESFGGSWLGAHEVAIKQIEPRPGWTPALQAAVSAELELYFDDFLRADRSFGEFPNADFNYVDATLAAFYGMSTTGRDATFQRVTDATDARRGYLGLAGALTVASISDRATPTLRGRRLLSRLLCTPVEDGPIDTPDGPRALQPGETNRSRVDGIQANAACAGCHREMDGFGMALESFDLIGAFHAAGADGTPVDNRGWLADGTPLMGEPALADAIAHDRRLLPCVARQAMRFALNRELDDADQASIDNVVARWKSGVPTLRALLEEIVLDDSFRMRRPEGQP
jgi:hypothetical protein